MYNREILEQIDNMPIKELFVKLELLNWQEEIIGEIQGQLTGGSLNLDGKSSMRRTCSFAFLSPIDSKAEQRIHLNSKFNLYIGLKNRLPKQYSNLGDILWFKEGVFIFVTASFTHNANNTSVNVTAKDKMCLLNGEVGGIIPDTVIFHEREIVLDDEDNRLIEHPLVYQIIFELVNHYGQEDLNKIFVNDVPLEIRQLMQYNGSRPVYLEESNEAKENYTGNYSYELKEGYKEIVVGEAMGYMLTDFIYPGELISNPGDSVTVILDKISNMLGNFEYFYDIDGNFHFQEIRNYLNNSYIPLLVKEQISEFNNNYVSNLTTKDYEANFDIDEVIYSFKKNKKLVSSVSNTPNYTNIKNDFVVWGVRKGVTGLELPVRYHLAIDDKPEITKDNNSPEWRERLYQYVMNGDSASTDMGYYEKEMHAEWRKLYNPKEKEEGGWGGWNPAVADDPKSLDFFIDFIDTNSEYGQFSVNNIGRRTIAIVDNDCTCVYSNDVPDIIFVTDNNEGDRLRAEGYVPCYIDSELAKSMRVSSNRKSCWDRIRELMYEHLTLNETISIQAIPVYWLEPNTKIEIEDEKSEVFGNYMINTITIPLSYNGQMSISASRALTRI